MNTQTNSRQRVKTALVNDKDLETLYGLHSTQDVVTFRQSCIDLIERSSGKRQSKDEFIALLNKTNSKDVMVSKVTNYVFAGLGLGV